MGEHHARELVPKLTVKVARGGSGVRRMVNIVNTRENGRKYRQETEVGF